MLNNPNTATPANPSTADLVAVDRTVEGVTGSLAFWRLEGEVSIQTLRDAVEAADLDYPLPEPATIQRALKRALEALAGGRDKLVEKHPKGGYAIVHKGETEDRDLRYTQGARVWWQKTDDGGHLAFDNADDALRTAVVNRVAHYRQTYVSEDISRWLPKLVASLKAVALRSGGGFYFVPAESVDTWNAWADVFATHTGHKLYGDIPAMHTDGMLEAVLDSIIEEAKQTIAKQTRGMADAGKRALASKETALEDLAEKLTAYEGILGRKLTELHDATEEAKGQVAAALLIEDEEG